VQLAVCGIAFDMIAGQNDAEGFAGTAFPRSRPHRASNRGYMSGIAGIIRFGGAPVEPGQIEEMTAAMSYRGPDGINHQVSARSRSAIACFASLEETQPLTNEDEPGAGHGRLAFELGGAGSANSRYCALISAFHNRLGVRALINTSFNENAPVVFKPQEAIDYSPRTNMDAFVLGDFVIRRQAKQRDSAHYSFDRRAANTNAIEGQRSSAAPCLPAARSTRGMGSAPRCADPSFIRARRWRRARRGPHNHFNRSVRSIPRLPRRIPEPSRYFHTIIGVKRSR
jgi:hypothetical protein